MNNTNVAKFIKEMCNKSFAKFELHSLYFLCALKRFVYRPISDVVIRRNKMTGP